MTAPKQPNSRRNLDIAINRLAKNEDDARRIRLIMANTIVAQMLPGGVIKGGSALKLRYGNDITRFTRDLDAARNQNLEEFISKLRSNLDKGCNDFTGEVVKRRPAKPEGIPERYVMQPFEVKLSYNQKSWMTVPFEVGHNEIGDADQPEFSISKDIVSLFTALGFPAPNPIALMPLHHQIAQKLHGASEPGSNRAHDLIDLQLIALEDDINLLQTKETCLRLFSYRESQSWPPTITKGENWDALYENQAEGLPVSKDVNDAIVWTNGFIGRINSATK